jgi:hypothetical protein
MGLGVFFFWSVALLKKKLYINLKREGVGGGGRRNPPYFSETVKILERRYI